MKRRVPHGRFLGKNALHVPASWCLGDRLGSWHLLPTLDSKAV